MKQYPNKLPSEIWDCGMSFKRQIATGDSIASVTAAVTTGSATTTNQTYSGTNALFRISGGVAGETCQVLITAITANGEHLSEVGVFSIVRV